MPGKDAILRPRTGAEWTKASFFSTLLRTSPGAPASYTVLVKERRRSVLHVDLDPFFVNVERSLDPALRGRAVIVGGGAGASSLVAAASAEARAAGVRPGQSIAAAQRVCPDAVVRRGDLDTYGRFSEEVSAILQAASRRVERPSADEAYVDVTPEHAGALAPVAAVETIKDEVQRRLGLDASLGLASSRLAARIASSWAKPRGFLLVLPGYEASFLARQPLSALGDLPPHLEAQLEGAGYTSLGQLSEADEKALAVLVGPTAATRLRAAARGEGEAPIEVSAPPTSIQEEALVRDARTDRLALEELLDGLARRASRRLRPFGLRARLVTVEVHRPAGSLRRSDALTPGASDEETLAAVVRGLAEPLLEPARTVRTLQVRLGRLETPGSQVPLFPPAFRSALR
jgi:DNA polymerase IV